MSGFSIFRRRELQDPPFVKFVFADTVLAPLWLFVRVYLGYQWLLAGSHKVWGDERWIAVEGEDGLSLKGFWERAVAIPEEGSPKITYDWYRDFLQYMLDHEWYHWMAWVISIGECTIGVMLIVGAFTGLAALGGATLNFNFLLAGTASTNPVMFLGAVLVLLGWKVAGWIGIDRWLLPALGTPWQPGPLVKEALPGEARGGAAKAGP